MILARDLVRDGLPADELARDPRLAAHALDRADADGDRVVSGDRETRALAALLDRADGIVDGRVRGGALHGAPSTAGPILDWVAERRAAVGREDDRGASSGPARRSTSDVARGGVVVVGMTESGAAEGRALARQAPVWLVTDPPGSQSDVVRAGDGTAFDLSRDEDRKRFVASLGLPADKTAAVARAIAAGAPGARRELGELARIWAPAERGEAIPDRLVVSGHGDGDVVFGTGDDMLRRDDLARLAAALPAAGSQVRHLHVASCQHGFEGRMAAYRAIFPNLDSIWGYAGFSPSGRSAQRHEAVWERTTRGEHPRGPSLADARGLPREAAVRVWTRASGFEGPRTRPLREISTEVLRGEQAYARIRSGLEPIGDPMRGWLASYYTGVQELVGHIDFREQSPQYQSYWLARRDDGLRLRLFETHVLPALVRVHGDLLARGYASVGLSAPHFATMTRPEALSAARAFNDALWARSAEWPRPAEQANALLQAVVVELRPDRIPLAWL